MKSENAGLKNPKRVAAGRRNRQKRGDLTPEGLQRLSDWADEHQPWAKSTGPRTAAGKAKSAQNGRRRHADDQSNREIKRDLADVNDLIKQMREIKKRAI